MWAIEAKTFGENAEYLRVTNLTKAQSRALHNDLTKEWPYVRSWDMEAEQKEQEAAERIRNWKKDAA